MTASLRKIENLDWRRSGWTRPPEYPRPPGNRSRFITMLILVAMGGFAAGFILPAPSNKGISDVVALSVVSKPAVLKHFSICGHGRRTNCVVDGDTFYFGGEKIRISDINTPEISKPGCARESRLGMRAQKRLHQLLNAGPVQLQRLSDRDRDQYGRKLRAVYRNGRSLGEVLVAEGLAHRWKGYKESWCG